jgi:hypothetical protein
MTNIGHHLNDQDLFSNFHLNFFSQLKSGRHMDISGHDPGANGWD